MKKWDTNTYQTCGYCGVAFPLIEDYWKTPRAILCRTCKAGAQKRNNAKCYAAHKDKRKQTKKEWVKKNKEKVRASKKLYRENNKDKVKAERDRYNSKPQNKIKRKEKQFEPWMNWENHGQYIRSKWDDNDPSTWKWQIDHIIPDSSYHYDSMSHPDFKKCWALDNLRPLSAKKNLQKGNKKVNV